MRVLLETSPLQNGHQGRGIGTYTRELLAGLRALRPREGHLLVQATHELEVPIVDFSESFDLVHYPYFDLFFRTFPRKSTVPRVVTIHDVIPLVFAEAYPPGLKGRVSFWWQWLALRNVGAVITDSECSKRDIHRYLHVPKKRIHVVPLAASPELQPTSEYLQQKYAEQLKLPNKYVVYVGDINYNKNLPTLLLALTQLPEDVHLCVVSQTFTNTAIPEGKVLQQSIKVNGLQERVHVLDIPKGETEMFSAVLARAKCLVQPSLYEGFGLPVLEAMQVGAIVVSSNRGSLPEVTGDAAILVEPTITGLADGIREAIHLRGEAREERIMAGLQRAAQFSWTTAAQRTYEVYQQVLQRAA